MLDSTVTEFPTDGKTRDNPFPGPRPYAAEQSETFFGRGGAVSQLTSLVLSSHIVLLHAQSGSGKSSLLEAGLKPLLAQRNIPIAGSVRFVRTAKTDSRAENPFVKRVVRALDRTQQTMKSRSSISDAVHAYSQRQPAKAYVLILDQFEELFTDSWLWQARDEFLVQLTDAVRSDSNLRVVIGMRSDYLARLIPYEHLLPASLVVRMALPSLTESTTRNVIRRAFDESRKPLSIAAIDRVVDALFEIGDADDSVIGRAEYANLIQLQIVCRRLWEQTSPGGISSGSAIELERVQTSVSESMVFFVDEAIDRISKRSRVDTSWVRNWLESLILNGNRRGLAALDGTHAPPRSLVRSLEDERLIRVALINDSRVAELTHDSMVEAIRLSNGSWRSKDRRRRIRRTLVLLIIVVTMSWVFLEFMVASPSVSLINQGGMNQTTAGYRTWEFTTKSDSPVGLVTVEIGRSGNSSPLSGRILVSNVTNGGPLDEVPLILGTSSYSIAVNLAPNSTYRVTLNTQDKVGYAFASAVALSGPPLVLSAAERQEVKATSPDPIAIRLSAGAYLMSGDYSLELIGNGVSPSGSGSFLILSQKDSLVVLKGLREGQSASITRVKQVEPTISKATGVSFKLRVEAVGRMSISWTDLPVRVEASCMDGGTPELNLYNTSTGNSLGWLVGGSLLREPGEYVLYIQAFDGKDHNCQINLHPESERISEFGVTQVSIPTGTIQSSLAFKFAEEGLVIVDVPPGTSYSLSCDDMSTAASSPSSKKFVGIIPASRICVLAIDGDNSSVERVLSVLTLKSPTGESLKVRR